MTEATPDRYRIEQRLGAGGMGAVYRANDTLLGRTVALKMLDGALLNEASRAPIMREARAASALSSPHICTVYEVSEFQGRPCIVMEYVDGESLADAIPPGGFPAALVLRYATQIADALAHAHDRGVIHRDLKSANVMVTTEGRTKVLDFGLAQRRREAEANYATEVDPSLSAHDPPSGTLPYMSPAILAGDAPGAADDLWSLGVLLYELATGELPFTGATRFQLATSVQRDPPAPLPTTIPAGLRGVIVRCLARDAGTRYQHAREVRAALDAVQAEVAAPPSRPGASLRRAAGVGGLIVLIVTLAAMIVRNGPSASTPERAVAPAVQPVAIAVLPFENVENDPDLDYLADGIPESVISDLARLPGKLTVTAWTAVEQYRGTVDASGVGQALGVGAVLRGSVVGRKDAVLVTVELVNVKDQVRLWGNTYTVTDLLGVQQEIGTEISAALELQLSRDEQQALQRHHPVTKEALDLYLRGQYHWYRFTPADYRRSLDYFREAIQRDGTYALAHAGVARVLSSMAYEGLLPPSAFADVEKAAATALSLDDSLGAAHDALAQVKFAYLWDPKAAEIEFRRALELSPRDEAVHRYYAIFLRTERRWDEAIAAMKRALALKPVSAEVTKALGATYFWAGQYDRAIEQYQAALILDPAHSQTHDLLADVYAAKGLYADALEARRRYLRFEGAFEAADALGTDGSEAGYRRAMTGLYRLYLARLTEDARRKDVFVSPMEFALTYIALGDTERAFAALDEAYSQRAPWLSSLAADPAFNPVRSDPRFARLLARVRVAYRPS